jgi:hypothetical protein
MTYNYAWPDSGSSFNTFTTAGSRQVDPASNCLPFVLGGSDVTYGGTISYLGGTTFTGINTSAAVFTVKRCPAIMAAPMTFAANAATDTAEPPARPACKHLGEPILNAEANRLSLDVRRTWRPCALNHGKAGLVCGCDQQATCAGCRDYDPPES